MNRRQRTPFRFAIAVAAASLASACTEWHEIPRANAVYPQGRLSRGKITLMNDSTVRIDDLRIHG
jgi:hypothetical protein